MRGAVDGVGRVLGGRQSGFVLVETGIDAVRDRSRGYTRLGRHSRRADRGARAVAAGQIVLHVIGATAAEGQQTIIPGSDGSGVTRGLIETDHLVLGIAVKRRSRRFSR